RLHRGPDSAAQPSTATPASGGIASAGGGGIRLPGAADRGPAPGLRPVGTPTHARRASSPRSLSWCRLDRRLLALGRWSMGLVSGPLDGAAATPIRLGFAVLREPKWIGDLRCWPLVFSGSLHATPSNCLHPSE